jgi:hypothetical protein
MRAAEAIGIALALAAIAVSGVWLAFLGFRRVDSSRWFRQVTVSCGVGTRADYRSIDNARINERRGFGWHTGTYQDILPRVNAESGLTFHQLAPLSMFLWIFFLTPQVGRV